MDVYSSQSTKLVLKDITNFASERKVIIVEGVPGVGKTTLAHKICRDWAEKKLLIEFSLVLYVPLRVPQVRLADSADDLLQYFGRNSPATSLGKKLVVSLHDCNNSSHPSKINSIPLP